MKRCYSCQEEKEDNEYYLRTDTNKYRNECIKCAKKRVSLWARKRYPLVKSKLQEQYCKNREQKIEYVKQWAMKNPEKRRKYQVSWRWKLRMEIIEAYGGRCVCCRESTPEFLQIDHIHDDGAKMRNEQKEQVGGALYRKLRSLGFPKENYQLLCANCNSAKSFFSICPHNIQENS